MNRHQKHAPTGAHARSKDGVAPIIVTLLCVVGLAVSGLSTRDHVRFVVSGGAEAGACGALSTSGCRAAHASAVAEVLGVPISHLGSAFYLAAAGLAVTTLVLQRRRGTTTADAGIAPVLTLMGLGAVVYSVFLASVLIRSGQACPFCIALYGVNVAMFLVSAGWWRRAQRPWRLRSAVVSGAAVATIAGAFLAATTPFLLRAQAERTAWAAVGGDSRPAQSERSFALPARLPSQGAPSASDNVVEFSDLECPHCASMHRTVAAVFEERGSAALRVRFVNYPLDRECNPYVGRSVHPTACLSARAGICAEQQGRFWPFVEAAFLLPPSRSRATLLDTAASVGLDAQRFETCLGAAETSRILAEDVAVAHAAGVRATPTLLVNGWAFEGARDRVSLLGVLDESRPCDCDLRTGDGACMARAGSSAPSSGAPL